MTRALVLVLVPLAAACGPRVLAPNEPVELVTDSFGITHVYAVSDRDAFFGAGYAMARDRLFQMELSRRRALGRLAELLGEKSLRGDRGARTFDFRRLGEADLERMRAERPDEAALIDAWADGVNRRIAEVRDGVAPRPYGFGPAELDFLPEPWRPAEAFAVGKLLAFGLSSSLDAEVLASVIAFTLPDVIGSLPLQQPAFDTFIVPGAPLSPSSPPLSPSSRPLSPTARPLPRGPEWLGEVRWRPPLVPASDSNNWAVAGRHSENGRPLLAGDPHQDLQSPTTLWPLHMSSVGGGGSLDVIGFSFPGTPMVQLGHNAHVGWTSTTNYADVMDLWDVERTSSTIKLGGRSWDIVKRQEIIRVRRADGSLEELPFEVEVVPGAGVLLAEELLPVPKYLFAFGAVLFNWTGFRATSEPAGYLGLDRARDLDELERAVDLLEVGAINLVAADKDGISYRVSAKVPDRGDPAGRPMPWRIVPGDDAESLWTRGDLPPARLPRARDPAAGVIFSANNDPFGFTADGTVENDPYYYGAFYSQATRAERIRQTLEARLAGGRKISHADMEAMQRDTESVLAQALVPRIEAAVAQVGSDPRLAAFVGRDDLFGLARRLAAWDRRCTREQEGPVLFMGVTWFAARRVFEPALTRSLFSGITTRSPPYVLGFLKNAVERRFPDAERFLPDGEALVWLQALDDTRAWLAQRFGATPPRYGDLFFAQFANGYGGALVPPLVPVDGCNDTIFVAEAALLDEDAAPRQQVTTRMMSLYRMVMSFDDDGVPYSTLNFSRGTRGDPGGPFFDDQQARWLSGEHVRLPFRKPDVEASATERHLLE